MMKIVKSCLVEMTLEEKVRLVGDAVGFAGLEPKEREELGRMGYGRLVDRGEFVFHEGDRADHLHMVDRGRVKMTKARPDGRGLTAVIAVRGYTLNAVTLFGSRIRFLSAQAMEDSLLMCLPAEHFLSFVQRHPTVAVGIITVLAKIVESSYERMVDMVGECVEQRLLNVLNMLRHRFGDSLCFTNTELADMAGTTTETTIRVVSRLRELGIIDTRRGEVRILDRSRLMELSRGPFLI
ncbi:MAG: Crp/Fnr family transcriptional regulator [Thermodesulfobacteriota bacterium]